MEQVGESIFRPVITENRLLPERVADQIADCIADGVYKPGDRLPGEYELAGMFGVGRSTVREAVKILVSKNVLKIQRGSGIYVCAQTGISDDPLGFRFVEDKKHLPLDLYEARLLIDPPIAELAAQRATEEELEKIQQMCDLCAQQVSKGEDYKEADVQFHSLIARATHNPVFSNLIPILHRSAPVFIDLTPQDFRLSTIPSHQAMVDAIRTRDVQKAREAALQHLERNLRHVQAYLNDKIAEK